MKKKFILYPFFGLLLYVLLSSYSGGPGGSGYERTGAGSSTGCGGGGCHSSSATSSTNVSITLLSGSTPVTTYTPGGSYTIQISGTQTSGSFTLPRFGFQVSAIKGVGSTPANAGSMSAPSGCKVSTISGITVIEHASALAATTGSGGSGTTYVVSIPWTAPAAGTGCVTLYGVLNAVNYNFSADGGDLWNNTSLPIYEAVGAITGATGVCSGSTIALTDATPCGVWSSSTTTVASVNTTGIVTGVNPGTATISYVAGTGNSAVKTVTVYAAPATINGITTTCPGSTTTLSNVSGAGTWTSGNTTVATAALGTGVITGVSSGTSVITFTFATTGCTTTTPVTVNPTPSAISGNFSICVSGTTALSNTGGGTWTSGTTTVATVVPGTGVVTGLSTGTSVISYTLSTGCAATAIVTVNPSVPVITGTNTVCPGLTTTLSNSSIGGTWVSSDAGTAIVGFSTGIVTGTGTGTAVITYTIGAGCASSRIVTVMPMPTPITGSTSVCVGLTTTLSNATAGGTWTSGSSATATIGSPGSGVVTGVTAGIANITYVVPVTACIATTTVAVVALPAPITGTINACPGTAANVSNSTSGGTWSSSNTSVATISGGAITTIVAGTTILTYTLGTGCISTATFTVDPLPNAITGITSVCSGNTTTLSNTGGGSWTSGNTTVASVDPATGIVTAIGLSGVVNITYTLPTTGCKTSTAVTINPPPAAITGAASFCTSASATFSNSTSGGTWSSSNTSIVTIGSTSGVATGPSTAGTATVTYTRTTTGCIATKIVTVLTSPVAITGIRSVCPGATTTLSNSVTPGTWSNSATVIATVNSSTGDVTGVNAGTTTITYTLTAGGCTVTSVVTVLPLPAAITGSLAACTGSTTSLTSATSGGTWSSSATTVATVASTGIVSGVISGTTTITYMSSVGCSVNKTVTVNTSPGAITGATVLCRGLTTTLSNAGGGAWTSSNTLMATAAPSTGVITGTGVGTATITYSAPVTGCRATTNVTVNALSPITGTTSLCAGLTTTLLDATGGGTWVSTSTSVATINTSTGFLTSITPGTSIINYTAPSGCVATTTVNIVSSPSAITGNTVVCQGRTAALSNTGGGSWTSSTTTVATVGMSTGIVTGSTLGTSTITYSLGTGCTTTTIVTVSALPAPITGTTVVCEGGTTALTDPTSGGAWTSSGANVTVDASGNITGVTAGTATISYALATGCSATITASVNPSPAAISGSTSVCKGATSTLSNAGGGTWSSSAPSVATIGFTTGAVIGVNAGTTSITYTLPTTGCKTTTRATVNPVPGAISGSSNVCTGGPTSLSNTGGGTWTSSNTNATVDISTGDVTGVSLGSSVITYTLPTGCRVTKTVTVIPSPVVITGVSSICRGASTTLTNTTTGGTWSSGTPAVASVGTMGNVSGISAGTSVITYKRSNGCIAELTVTVNPLPAPISGTLTFCTGSVSSLSTNLAGGNWTSSNTAVATVDPATGDATGIAAGTTNISYILGTGCNTGTIITITPPPTAITGPAGVCIGLVTTFSNSVSGGTWSSSNTSVAIAGSSSGIITGVTPGTTTITYQITPSCLTTTIATVNPTPGVITGPSVVCSGNSIALTDAAPGGNWSSNNTSIATIDVSTAVITGGTPGTTTISYTLPTSCAATYVIKVNPVPSPITGSTSVCLGLTLKLTNASTGGTWSSSTPSVATTSGTGLIGSVSAGTSTISYTLTSGCASTATVTVNPMPAAIAGAASVCEAAAITLSNATTGGIWSSSTGTIATISTTSGLVSGVAPGSATITYSLATGCKTIKSITVNPLPSAGIISGSSFVCGVAPISLYYTIAGGTWSSSNTAIATIDAIGMVNGISNGVVTISYSVSNSCGIAHATHKDTVYATPAAGAITGKDSVCPGSTIVLSNAIAGGVWSSSNTSIATVLGGTITGVSPGIAIISYSIGTPCGNESATLSIKVRTRAACNTAVNAVVNGDGFKVYPNPTAGSFVVDIPATEQSATITVMDMLGKVLEVRTLADNKKQQAAFHLEQFARGSYIVKVNAGDVVFRQKIELW